MGRKAPEGDWRGRPTSVMMGRKVIARLVGGGGEESREEIDVSLFWRSMKMKALEVDWRGKADGSDDEEEGDDGDQQEVAVRRAGRM